jgi:hypothetical protein
MKMMAMEVTLMKMKDARKGKTMEAIMVVDGIESRGCSTELFA